jgi:hypothetical protein
MHGMIIVASGFWLWLLCISGNSFLKYNSTVSCGSSDSTQVNRDPTSKENNLNNYGNLCTAGVKKDTDYGEKCGK